jgi:group I intron endonuclease
MGYIYIIENIVNGKKYIGQTLQNDINKRWRQHKSKNKNSIGQILFNAYQKYGINNFKFKILCICFDCDTNRYEIDYIKKYNTIYPNGYNLLEGGNNKKHNEYTKNILRQKLSGQNHPNFDKKFSQERKMKISISKKGNLNPNYGKTISNEQKEKIKNTIKEFEKDKRDKINKQISETLKLSVKNCKSVFQYDLNDNFIKEYNSISEASQINCICRSSIQRCCDGKYKTSKGFIWKYKII